MAAVGWAFVGSGGWVNSRFAPSVLAAGHRVIGAFGSAPTGSAQFAERHGCAAYGSLGDLLDDPAVEAVWVASPPAMHAAHARLAAEHGKAVLIEKPLTVDVAEARGLAEDLATATPPVGVGFQHRFNPGVRALADALARPGLGALSSVVLHQGYPGPPAPPSWRADPAQGGGWSLGDLGTHLIDVARDLIGEVEFCAARLSSPTRGGDANDLSVVMLTHGPATVVVRASTGSVGPPSFVEISGAQGWLRLVDFWGGGGQLIDSSGGTVDITPGDPYAAEVAAFSAAVRGGRWDGASLVDGVRVVELAAAARAFRL